MNDISDELEQDAQEESKEEKAVNSGALWLLAFAVFLLAAGWEVIRHLYFSS